MEYETSIESRSDELDRRLVSVRKRIEEGIDSYTRSRLLPETYIMMSGYFDAERQMEESISPESIEIEKGFIQTALDEMTSEYELSYLAQGKDEEDAHLLASMQAIWSLQYENALPEEREYLKVFNSAVGMMHEALDRYLDDEFEIITFGRDIKIELPLSQSIDLQVIYNTRGDKVQEQFYVYITGVQDTGGEPPFPVTREQLNFMAPEVDPVALQNMTILALEMACDQVFE